MKIGLSSWATATDALVEQARRAESEGFAALWYASGVTGDPLVAMALAGRATSTIELGTAVLQTYPCHPLLQANRISSVTKAFGRPGFTLGIGPSHEQVVRDVYHLSYDRPGENTEEYVRILAGLLRGDDVVCTGRQWSVDSRGRMVAPDHPVPILLAGLGPRLLRVAGELTDGTVLWLATARVIETYVAPKIRAAATSAGRPSPRIVAGLPVAVHDDIQEAREVQVTAAKLYDTRTSFARVVALNGSSTAADVAVVGNETSVAKQLHALLDAGATEIHAAPFPVGDDARSSLRRTRDLLASLVA